MQNSELFRRGVVLPHDDMAEERLFSNEVDMTVQVNHLRIQNDDLFQKLWNSGLFLAINHLCGTQIDDYEESVVKASDSHKLLQVIEAIINNDSAIENDIKAFLLALRALAIKAMERDKPIFFIL